MKNIEKFRIVFGILFILFVIYDNYINKSDNLLPPYGLFIFFGLNVIIYYFAKLKK